MNTRPNRSAFRLHTLSWLLGTLLLCLPPSTLPAASACFSLDAQHVYLLGDKDTLEDADLKTHTISPVQVHGKLLGASIEGISLTNSGNVLCVTTHSLFSYDPKKAGYTKMCDAPEGVVLGDVACNPKDGSTLLVGFEQAEGKDTDSEPDQLWLQMLPPDGGPMFRVWSRRADQIEGASFDDKGWLYFGCHGDLWKCRVGAQQSDDCTTQPQKTFDYLVGKRIAALATLETSESNSEQMGVRECAPAGGKIYVHIHRMGGIGWGALARVANPSQLPEDDLKQYAALYARESVSLEELDFAASGRVFLCSSRDGKRVFYRTLDIGFPPHPVRTKSYWLVEKHGKPKEVIRIKEEQPEQ